MSSNITIAMVGNPNSGKTTLFNALTGQRQRVANYPGVTVEIMEGEYSRAGRVIDVIDLPGTYSLDSASPDALVARDFILNHPKAMLSGNLVQRGHVSRIAEDMDRQQSPGLVGNTLPHAGRIQIEAAALHIRKDGRSAH